MRIPTLLDSIMLNGIDEQWIVPLTEPVSPWEYVKELDCWRHTETGEVKPYQPEDEV
jgi:hypothetical protein